MNPMQQQQPHLVAQQLLDLSSKPLQHLMGLRDKPMMNSMANPMMNPMVNPMANTMHTTRLPNQMATSVHNPLMHQQNRSKNNYIFSALDDNVITKQVVDTHLPDGNDVDVKPLLDIVEDIIRYATINVDSTSLAEHTDVGKVESKLGSKPHEMNTVVMLNSLSHVIEKLASEMSLRCLSVGDGHTTALALLHMVGNFHWDAKLVLTLAAFALNHGDFCLLGQIHSSNQLGSSMAILRQVPMMMENSASLKPRFDILNKLIRSVLELTRCIMQFNELPSMYVTPDVPTMAKALNIIPTAVYWSFRGIVACATLITSITSNGHEYGKSSLELQPWELSTLILRINQLDEFFKKQLENCHRVVGERREMDFRNSFNQLFETVHIDNMKILKILISPRDDNLPLFDGATKKRVSLEVLRKRNVLLLISGLDMSSDELSILEQIYSESRIQGKRGDALYEVLWMPIVDPWIEYTEAMNKKFEEMKNRMPWFSVYHPSIIDRAVKRSIGDRWHFRSKPILVVLDLHGRELSPNAIHMMWIWGSNAFPFTSAREEALWREETWRLELLVSGMDPTILNWIRDDKYIFLYGGDDIEWIRKFTSNARAMATAARIPLEMAYVGKSKKRENVRRAIAAINVEKLSYTWQDTILIWFFWARIESMLFSKIQLKRDDDQDLIMLQIKKLLSYDKDGSWALLCRGSQILTNGHGSTMLETLTGFDLWKEHVPTRGFDLSFRDYHDKLYVAAGYCCQFEFPITAGRIPEGMRCPECHRLMEKYTAFLCCHDQTGLLEPY
ncbi:unnamed protein product [Lactuca saligna]|uniref:Sieve element occlusion N-terminal domain-containing protein n=1 Tax=Lactuca saligna TaxID=75948 RepID=A0AA36DUB9_LACSI|nr:unnamed protein product [Lactuca saligna]